MARRIGCRVGRGSSDHGHHAAFDRGIFLELDGYDESFSHNEDAEFDTRLTRSGRQIYLDGTSAVTYYPRASLPTLARQYFAYGRGRASTLLKHRTRPRVRQVLPVAIVLGCLVSLILAAFDWRFAGLTLLYALPCIGWGLGLAAMQKDACLAFSGPAAIVMHVSWGLGFLARLVRFKAAAAGTGDGNSPEPHAVIALHDRAWKVGRCLGRVGLLCAGYRSPQMVHLRNGRRHD